MKLRNILLLFFPVLLLTACNKFLDVKPKTQIDTDDAFRDEQGFMDALTGVYLKMNENTVYGKELSFGLTEVLSMQHSRFTSTFHEYYYAAQYNYTNAAIRSKIDGIWKGLYNAVANDNSLISHLNTTDQRMFRDVNYSIIRGEAYGLRAFLHFDLLRLFAPAPASAGGLTAKAIPYMDQLTVNALPRLTVQEITNRILADCAVAEAALKTTDPIVPGSTTPTTTTGYLRDRSYKFNYFAVKALQARVYLYIGDKEKARAAAEEVINTNAFAWINIPEISSGNKVFTSELIFALYKSDMDAFTTSYFTPSSTNVLTKTNSDEFLSIYETDADVRYTALTALENTSTNLRVSTKLAQPAGVSLSYLRKMPIMRISEMYYIAAEALKESNPEQAVAYLNTVRRARNVLVDLPATLNTEQIQEEIFKEYRKDLYCEGQLFFYYKRLNLPTIVYSSVKADNKVYVLPLPDNEVEYGNGN
ncbi:RagB/SusD family nutrient uptake outer membrane protein [Chitinophaga filiformis]|uniref:RagB/SusD family nutrient uptake outer membrane protein n=1 Tax=Chitinophaga filiformis TaxID=104663 RepID=A0ABY4HXX1_CHIFI|nr:RagB/SusD family nutrient uptake outer membrane protein [Chitinophaga filiformis]UPK67808.1 RagB/SusD family nutrient uptake outer membrane protein [Chitinophaga filiformis]